MVEVNWFSRLSRYSYLDSEAAVAGGLRASHATHCLTEPHHVKPVYTSVSGIKKKDGNWPFLIKVWAGVGQGFLAD